MEVTRRAFALLSGGLDSTTLLYLLHKTSQDAFTPYNGGVEAISIHYGQRHAKEISKAASIAFSLGIAHTVLELPADLLSGVMLTDKDAAIPDVKYDDIQGVSPTYVPFRNGLMLSMLASYAHKWAMDAGEDEKLEAVVAFGAHAEDAANWAYPDCSPEFIGAMANAVYVATYHAVRLIAPFQHATKSDIVVLGARLGVPFKSTWSCYAGDELHCGACPTCHSRHHAFVLAGVKDPTEYASPPRA